MNIDIHWMYDENFTEVLAIEKSSFSYPWSEEDFRNELAQPGIVPMVAEVGGEVVAYLIYELLEDSLNIVSMAVDAEFQRCGIGREMVSRITSRLNKKRKFVSAIVSERMLEAQLFFKGCGFRCEQTNKWYFGGEDDAYVFRYRAGKTSRIKEVL